MLGCSTSRASAPEDTVPGTSFTRKLGCPELVAALARLETTPYPCVYYNRRFDHVREESGSSSCDSSRAEMRTWRVSPSTS